MLKILEKLGKLDIIEDSITAQEVAVGQLKEKLDLIDNNCAETREVTVKTKEESPEQKSSLRT